MNQFVETIAAVPMLAPPAISGEELMAHHFSEARGLAKRGVAVFVLGVLPVVAWLSFAPLASAVVAPGYMKVDLNRRTVQHAEGGIVRAVHVRDGQQVHKGEPLLELGDVSVAADKQRLRSRLLFEQAGLIRLEAEQARQANLAWPAELTEAAKSDPVLAEQMGKEFSLFMARREALVSQSRLLQSQREKILQEKESLKLQIVRAQESLHAQRQELEVNRKLVKDGFIAATRILELEATVADYGVKLEERRNELVRADQRIVDIDLKLRALENDYRQQASDQLKVANIRVSDIDQELRKASDAATRQVIVAPVDGEVMGLRFSSPGTVIAPRETVLEVVPANPQLLVEARIRTDDINRVHMGQQASVRFTAFKYRTTSMVPGKITYVSADRIVERETNQTYYTVQVEVDAQKAAAELGDHKLQAGMSAEVYVDGENRTPLRYLMEPLTDVLRRAARER
jgi:HlyD family type I secretion membrane fusion protein